MQKNFLLDILYKLCDRDLPLIVLSLFDFVCFLFLPFHSVCFEIIVFNTSSVWLRWLELLLMEKREVSLSNTHTGAHVSFSVI